MIRSRRDDRKPQLLKCLNTPVLCKPREKTHTGREMLRIQLKSNTSQLSKQAF